MPDRNKNLINFWGFSSSSIVFVLFRFWMLLSFSVYYLCYIFCNKKFYIALFLAVSVVEQRRTTRGEKPPNKSEHEERKCWTFESNMYMFYGFYSDMCVNVVVRTVQLLHHHLQQHFFFFEIHSNLLLLRSDIFAVITYFSVVCVWTIVVILTCHNNYTDKSY